MVNKNNNLLIIFLVLLFFLIIILIIFLKGDLINSLIFISGYWLCLVTCNGTVPNISIKYRSLDIWAGIIILAGAYMVFTYHDFYSWLLLLSGMFKQFSGT